MEKLMLLNQQLCPDHHHSYTRVSYIRVSFESVAIRYTSLLACCYRLLAWATAETVNCGTRKEISPGEKETRGELWNFVSHWINQSSHKTIFHNLCHSSLGGVYHNCYPFISTCQIKSVHQLWASSNSTNYLKWAIKIVLYIYIIYIQNIYNYPLKSTSKITGE